MLVSLFILLLYFKEESITFKAARFEVLCQIGSYTFLLIVIAIFDFRNRTKLKKSFYKDLPSLSYSFMNIVFFINLIMEGLIFYHSTNAYFQDVDGTFQEIYLWVFHSCGLVILVYILYFINIARISYRANNPP